MRRLSAICTTTHASAMRKTPLSLSPFVWINRYICEHVQENDSLTNNKIKHYGRRIERSSATDKHYGRSAHRDSMAEHQEQETRIRQQDRSAAGGNREEFRRGH